MMRKRKIHDPYTDILSRFNRNGVKYVIVGMAGINYYAENAQATFATQDFDIFIKPTISNVKKAMSILKESGYNLSYDKKGVEPACAKDIVKKKNTVLATDPYGVAFELILAVSGYNFNQMLEDSTIFIVGKTPVKVGKLTKLLLSKRIAGRKKDRLFLRRYEMLLKEKCHREK
jgi:predicted nucleotidyltransferase